MWAYEEGDRQAVSEAHDHQSNAFAFTAVVDLLAPLLAATKLLSKLP